MAINNPILNPTVVHADGYNDLVIFNVQNRFADKSLLRVFTIKDAVQRDFANFAMVNLSSTTPQYYSISMQGPVYNKTSIAGAIDTTIRELLNA